MAAPGRVGTRARFAYRETDGGIWPRHAGVDVVRGHPVATRDGDRLDVRSVRLKRDGIISSGHCVSAAVALPDGRVRPVETREWG